MPIKEMVFPLMMFLRREEVLKVGKRMFKYFRNVLLMI